MLRHRAAVPALDPDRAAVPALDPDRSRAWHRQHDLLGAGKDPKPLSVIFDELRYRPVARLIRIA
jgi:hypothetical protein